MDMGLRRRAREGALQVLYQIDVQPELRADLALSRFMANFAAEDADAEVANDDAANAHVAAAAVWSGEVRTYLDRLVSGVADHLDDIDARITRASRNWRLERMARVDRNLLRLAVYEMTYESEVPDKVAINEAIEIAKRFGTAESPAFVNGILDRVLGEHAGA